MAFVGLALASVGGLMLWSAVTGEPLIPTIADTLQGRPFTSRRAGTPPQNYGGSGAGSGGAGGGGSAW